MKSFRLAVCKGPDCTRGGGDTLFIALREGVARRALGSRCEVYRGGCYGLCHLGPNVVIRDAVPGKKKDPFSREDFELTNAPGEAHYAGLQASQADRLIEEHIGRESPVLEWLAKTRAGTPK